MSALLVVLGAVFLLAGLASVIIVLIAAFQDAWWKGLLAFIPCLGGLWWLYYVLFEYESDYKFGIAALALFGNGIGWELIGRALAGHGR